MAIDQGIFSRAELLVGGETMERIAQKRVIIFGVGGVGSWCAESLVRSGIHQLTIVDSDCVCITNINRQLMATTKTIGQVKVDALKERLLTINPEAEITALQKIFTQETAEEFNLDSYDYIIDAIDSLKDKALLILMACRTKAKFFSSIGLSHKGQVLLIHGRSIKNGSHAHPRHRILEGTGRPIGTCIKKKVQIAAAIPQA